MQTIPQADTDHMTQRAPARRLWQRLALVLAAALLLAAAVLPQTPLSAGAARHARAVATASAGTYVTLRTLNAFLSTAQEIEVGGGFVVSGTVQPLKVLEPIDDTVERIASVVFALMLVSGVLSVAMGPVGAVGMAMMAGALVLWAIAPQRALGRRLAVYGAFLGLALPLSFLLSGLLAEHMTADVWAENSAVIARITQGVEPPAAGDEAGWWNRMQASLGGIERYQTLAANIFDQADDMIASYIAILGVFIFRLFVLPLLLAGGFFVIARWGGSVNRSY